MKHWQQLFLVFFNFRQFNNDQFDLPDINFLFYKLIQYPENFKQQQIENLIKLSVQVIKIQFLTVMDNEYILQPLDPLEISFSKDKCNCSGTPKPSPTGKENLLPNTATPGGSNSKDYLQIRHHSLSKPLPIITRNSLPRSYPSTDTKYCQPFKWDILTSTPRRPRGYSSTMKKRLPSAIPQQPLRRTLDYRDSHEKEMGYLDDMLRRINLQLESSARCLEKFASNNRRH